jgi:hypothetical protein
MCRSIKVLRRPEQAPTAGEFDAAALQFVRKISGFQKPSERNREAFERAVAEVSGASKRLLESLQGPKLGNVAGGTPGDAVPGQIKVERLAESRPSDQ